MEYYLVLKRKEILTHARTWMNTEDIILTEISQLAFNDNTDIKITTTAD